MAHINDVESFKSDAFAKSGYPGESLRIGILDGQLIRKCP